MSYDSTVVYYTSNRECESFENKIKTKLLNTINKVGLPLISVSQKPINFGHNICVGDVGVSNHNVFKQLYIGAEQAKTKFIISAEADFLYPEEYFKFIPSDENRCYRNGDLYILYSYKGNFLHKHSSEGCQVCGRDFLLKNIEKYLEGSIMWNNVLEHGKQVKILFKDVKWTIFNTEIAAISVKTSQGMHRDARTDYEASELPYWGNAETLRKELFYAL